MRSVRVAILATAAVVLVLLVAVLAPRSERLASTNSEVPASGVALPIYPGKRLCHRQYVPAGSGALRVYVQPLWVSETGPLQLVVQDARGAPVARARFDSVRTNHTGLVADLSPIVKRPISRARVCVVNAAPTPIELAGNKTPSVGAVGQEFDDDVRVDILRTGRESGFAIIPEVADRLPLIKAPFLGPWALWALMAATVATWLLTMLLVLRSEKGR